MCVSRTTEGQYSATCEVVNSRAILSVGVACCRHRTDHSHNDNDDTSTSSYIPHSTTHPHPSSPNVTPSPTGNSATISDAPSSSEPSESTAITHSSPTCSSELLESTSLSHLSSPEHSESAVVSHPDNPECRGSQQPHDLLPESGKKRVVPVGESDWQHCLSLCVETFNVWVKSESPFTIDPSSAGFLVQHGFDFNKHFSQGIPYTPGRLTVRPLVAMAIII